MRRLVLDTSVVVAAFRSRNGAGHAILQLVGLGILVPLMTPALFLQYEEVLKRPEQLKASKLTSSEADLRLRALASATEPVRVHYYWRPQLPDANDELVFEAAVNGQADALVTYNIRHFAAAAKRFGLRVARPVEVLEEVTR